MRKPPCVWEGEEGQARRLTYAELRHEVNRLANALRALGLGKGDAIGVFMPMTPEIVVAMLAIIKIGGVFLPALLRVRPAGHRVAPCTTPMRKRSSRRTAVFAAAKSSPMKPVADEAAAQIPTLQHVIVLKRIGDDVPWNAARDHWWHDLMANARDEAPTEATSAEDPLMIIYTSGTTGRPKGAVHTHCGFPVKAAQDMSHGLDLHADETLFWVTDMGWMMGPWLVFGTLLLGATMMLYDGAPDWPGPDRLWSLVAKHSVTSLGISPTLVRALIRHGEEPVRTTRFVFVAQVRLDRRAVESRPVAVAVQRRRRRAGCRSSTIPAARRFPAASSWATCSRRSNRARSPARCPAWRPMSWTSKANPCAAQVGELVIRQPWIGMTRGFWRDPQRYLETYWSRFPNVWVHGDWAAVDGDGLWYILGRSDDTIKIAGKRLGPAEVESVLVGHPAVSEAAAIGVPDELKGEALVCFCVLKQSSSSAESGIACARNSPPASSTNWASRSPRAK